MFKYWQVNSFPQNIIMTPIDGVALALSDVYHSGHFTRFFANFASFVKKKQINFSLLVKIMTTKLPLYLDRVSRKG